MAVFEYHDKRSMEPRGNKNYATVYYQQSQAQRTEMRSFIESVVAEIGELAESDPDFGLGLTQPLKRFPRSNGTRYSALDIIEDLWQQLKSNKDPTEAMIGRWNRLWSNDQDYQITMRAWGEQHVKA